MGKFEWAELIAAISLVVAAVGVAIALVQSFRKLKQRKVDSDNRRAEFLGGLITQLKSDKDLYDVAYMIDYGQTWYNGAFPGGSETERKVDKTFAFYSYICYLRKTKIISDKEFSFFEYRIKRTLIHSDTIKYLDFLYDFSEKNKAAFAYSALLDYGIELKLYDGAKYSKITKYD